LETGIFYLDSKEWIHDFLLRRTRKVLILLKLRCRPDGCYSSCRCSKEPSWYRKWERRCRELSQRFARHYLALRPVQRQLPSRMFLKSDQNRFSDATGGYI